MEAQFFNSPSKLDQKGGDIIYSPQAEALEKKEYCPFQFFSIPEQEKMKEDIKLDFSDIPKENVDRLVSHYPFRSPDSSVQTSWEQEATAEYQEWLAPHMSVVAGPRPLVEDVPNIEVPGQIIPTQAIPITEIPVQAAPIMGTPVQVVPVMETPAPILPAMENPVQVAPIEKAPVQADPNRSELVQEPNKALAFLQFKKFAQSPSFSTAPEEINSEYDLMEKTASHLQFVRCNGMIYYYNGHYYELLDDMSALGKILDVCRTDIQDIGRFLPIKNAYEFLRVDSRFQAPDEWIAFGCDYVTFLNGNLNWKTGEFVPHSPGIFTTYAVRANYLGTAVVDQPVRFLRFLNEAGGGSCEWIKRALEMLGYCLIPDISGKCALLLQGKRDSGKSQLCNFLSSLLPDNKVAALDIHDLGKEFAAAELEGAVICVAPDMPATPLKEEAVGRIKALSGNDQIQANQKYKRYKKFRFTGTFIMCTNHPLLTKVPDPAFNSRIITLPFLFSTPPDKQDPDLLLKFQAERDLIVTLAINAYFQLRANNYRFAGDFKLNASDAFESTNDNILELIIDFSIKNLQPLPNGCIYVSDAYARFLTQYKVKIDLATFGGYLRSAITAIWGVKPLRKRRPGGQNPTSCYEGLAFTI